MSPRLIGLLAFVATWLALNAWGNRRDRMSNASFEVTPPANFTEEERGSAAMIVADDDANAARALAKKGGALYFHFEESSPPEREYLEVIEIEEDPYPLRPDEDVRLALYGSGKLTVGKNTLDVLDSRVTRLGHTDAVVARLSAKVGDKDVRLIQYLVPSDRGRAVVDCFCLAVEEDTYRPQFDAMVAGARGVAYRPKKLAFPIVVGVSAAVGLLAFFLAMRAFSKRHTAAPSLEKDEERKTNGSDEAE